MNKFLSLIIPTFNEREEDLFPLLSSINNQCGVNFSELEILIINDAGRFAPEEDYFSRFGRISDITRYVRLEQNGGPGVARQAGIDLSCGEYVMFCDADDLLHNVAILGLFIKELRDNHYDVLASRWVEELKTDSGYIYVTHDDEATWMFGKALKRSYLQRFGIRFHDSLRVHEDSYFLALAYEYTEHKAKLPFDSYVWKFNENSITRINNGSYTYDSMPVFIEALRLAAEDIEKKKPSAMASRVVQMMFYIYFSLKSEGWNHPDNKKYLEETHRSLYRYYQQYQKYFDNAPVDLVRTVYNNERQRLYSHGMENETFQSWFDLFTRTQGEMQSESDSLYKTA